MSGPHAQKNRQSKVELVPYTDKRLNRRYTKALIFAIVLLTLGASVFMLYYLWPRQVTADNSRLNYYVEGLVGGFGDRNCPATDSSCELREEAAPKGAEEKFCNNMSGCAYDTAFGTPGATCTGCADLKGNAGISLCRKSPQCVMVNG